MPRRKKQPAALVTQMRNNLDSFGWCRANQHIWNRPSGGALQVLGSGRSEVVRVAFKCEQCTGERHDTVSLRTGELVQRSYQMPAGYLMKLPNGMEKPTKLDWRREHYGRLVREGSNA